MNFYTDDTPGLKISPVLVPFQRYVRDVLCWL